MIKKSQFIFLCLILLFSSCNFDYSFNGGANGFGPSITGNGISKTQSRTLQSFSALVVDGSITTVVTINDHPSLAVTADENLVDHIKTEFKGETLSIYTDASYTSSLPLLVNLSTSNLNQISLSGSASSSVAGIKNDSLKIETTGSGLVSLTGQTNQLNVEMSGSGRLLASELTVQNAKITIAGSGSAVVNPIALLDAKVTGSGTIQYVNTPAQLKQQVLGSGSILKK